MSPAATCWPSSTATLTMVPCIGEVRESPLAAAPAFLPFSRFGFFAPAAAPAPAAAAKLEGRTASIRRPPTSTVTAFSPLLAPGPVGHAAVRLSWLSNSVSIQLVNTENVVPSPM